MNDRQFLLTTSAWTSYYRSMPSGISLIDNIQVVYTNIRHLVLTTPGTHSNLISDIKSKDIAIKKGK